ncbi:MAG: FAD:protein FMN transferase, partial [Planctomycetota bacterium]
MTQSPRKSSRRDLLAAVASPPATGTAATPAPAIGPASGHARKTAPAGGSTLRLSTRAMACDFSVILNPSSHPPISAASEALERIHAAERWMSIYRDDSEISVANRLAGLQPIAVSSDFLHLLTVSARLHRLTEGAFDLASGRLTQLWRMARKAGRLPEPEEVESARGSSGFDAVQFDAQSGTLLFARPELLLDPGAIGKGLALDDAAVWLCTRDDAPPDFLIHGGHSSLLARGGHNGHAGFPVGLGNPLLTSQRMATLVLTNQAMGTSGSNIQFFRHEGRRYGHILNPATGWPAEGVLSATVLAPSAAVADALSTVFFAIGPEKAVDCCRRMPEICMILT